jgi:hypothetical protein
VALVPHLSAGALGGVLDDPLCGAQIALAAWMPNFGSKLSGGIAWSPAKNSRFWRDVFADDEISRCATRVVIFQ